ncbi:MAG: hypothetical protein PHQ40_10545 [Anaerolineaceae bacterium]|nr:hypothetical protein [Anaerolineaceae bacterium]
MLKVSSTLLTDTLQLVQLAREIALAGGKQAEAERLSPLVQHLHAIVLAQRGALPPGNPPGILAQDDFSRPLQAGQSSTVKPGALSLAERNQMVVALSAGNLADVDIARQFTMTRDEVRMVLDFAHALKPVQEL